MTDDARSKGIDLQEEMADDPRHSDKALVRHLREQSRALGMLFGVDKAVMRAALVAALPDVHRERAIRLLGEADPMLLRVVPSDRYLCFTKAERPPAKKECPNEHTSAAQVVLDGLSELLEVQSRIEDQARKMPVFRHVYGQ